jgi:hypothetical protein
VLHSNSRILGFEQTKFVGIGASAGVIAALLRLFERCPVMRERSNGFPNQPAVD